MGDISDLALKLVDKVDGLTKFLVPLALTGIIAGAALKLLSKPLVFSTSGAAIDAPLTLLVTSSSLLVTLGLFALGSVISRIASQFVDAEKARITAQLKLIRGNLMTGEMAEYDAYNLISEAMVLMNGEGEFLIDIDAVEKQEDPDYYRARVWELKYFADKRFLAIAREEGTKNVWRVILDPDVASNLRLGKHVNEEETERLWNIVALPTLDKWKAAILGIPHVV